MRSSSLRIRLQDFMWICMRDIPDASVQREMSCFCTVRTALYSVACSGVNVPLAGKVRAGGYCKRAESRSEDAFNVLISDA